MTHPPHADGHMGQIEDVQSLLNYWILHSSTSTWPARLPVRLSCQSWPVLLAHSLQWLPERKLDVLAGD